LLAFLDLSKYHSFRLTSSANAGATTKQLVGFYSTVARLFRTFPAKVAGKFEKILLLQKCRVKQLFQTPFFAKGNG
jgi:hypothetical protein